MNARQKRWAVFAGIVLAASAAGWHVLRSHNEATYVTTPVERGDVKASISATGTINPVVTVQVGSQVSGNIKALYADFNTKVKKGQIVALIDPEIFQARVNQAQASVDSAHSSVANAQAGVARAAAELSSAEATVASQKAGVARAKVAVADAKAKYNRRVEMFQAGVASQEDLDTAKATYNSAQEDQNAAVAQLDAAQHAIAAAQASQTVSQTVLVSAQAQVKQAEATLHQAQLDLDHTEIVAPVEGTVIARRMDVGQTVAASFQAPTIFEIAQDLTKMQVDTNIDEADIGHVRTGQDVNFTVDAYPSTHFRGVVSEIRKAPINTQNVITYDSVVTVPNPDLKLLPGMTANVRIQTGAEQNVLKVTNAALRFRPEDQPATRQSARGAQSTVYVLRDEKPVAVPITLGLSDGSYTAVKSGELNQGDPLITAMNGTGTKSTTVAAAPRGRRGPGF
jgi:HlyD family secretion protein